jgi:hypothetical protein
VAEVFVDLPDDGTIVTVVDSNEVPENKQAKTTVDNTAGFADLRNQLSEITKQNDESKRAIEEERRQRQQADRRAAEALEEANKARSDAQAARRDSVTGRKEAFATSITAKREALKSMESDLATALEAGDFKRVANLQVRISQETAGIVQLEGGVAALDVEDTDDQATRRTEGRVEKKTTQADESLSGFEKYIRQFSPTAQEWLRKHPDCVNSQTKNAQMIAAHHEACDKGYERESEAYFAYLERKLGYRDDAAKRAVEMDNPVDRDDPRSNQREDNPMRSAPVSRNGNGNGRSSRVTLTEGEARNAQDGTIVWNIGNTDMRGNKITKDDPRLGEPIGLQEMAFRKRKLETEGRYAVPML